ncbi:hypothetical protein GCM10010330_44860 [Streptomyces tendae]|nr:hypothetical protein GCM10010330_44860 [Streptomyces tendae]
MIPTIEEFLNARTAHGSNRSVPLDILRAACADWARKRHAPFPEMGAIEDALKRRNVRISMVGRAVVARGIGLERPTAEVPNPGAAEIMRKIAGASHG